MDNRNDKTPVTVLRLLLGGVVLTFLSFVSDVSSIVSSGWFKALLSSSTLRWAPHILNLLLAIFVIYLYRKSQSDYKAVDAALVSTRDLLNSEGRLNNRLWKRYVRTLRSIVLESISTPGVRESLEPILDELAKKLPDSGVDFKVGLVKPCKDGRFKFLAERGMDPASVHSMEKKSNWKQSQSFFANGLYLSDERPYRKYASGTQNYSNIQRDQGIGSSVSHFVVAIKDPVYSESTFPENTVAVLSIGIPKRHDFDSDEDENLFYERIYPFVKGIESILLNQMTIDKTLGVEGR